LLSLSDDAALFLQPGPAALTDALDSIRGQIFRQLLIHWPRLLSNGGLGQSLRTARSVTKPTSLKLPDPTHVNLVTGK
jgi:hypothetical protein